MSKHNKSFQADTAKSGQRRLKRCYMLVRGEL